MVIVETVGAASTTTANLRNVSISSWLRLCRDRSNLRTSADGDVEGWASERDWVVVESVRRLLEAIGIHILGVVVAQIGR